MKRSTTDPRDVITLYIRGKPQKIERGKAPPNLIRYVFGNGDVIYMPNEEVLAREVSGLRTLYTVTAESRDEAEMDAQRQRGLLLVEKDREECRLLLEASRVRDANQASVVKRQKKNRARDAKIRDAAARFKDALYGYALAYDRKTLPKLLLEFKAKVIVDKFKPSDVNKLLGKRFKLSPRRISQILAGN
jgi:hypothetical protein